MPSPEQALNTLFTLASDPLIDQTQLLKDLLWIARRAQKTLIEINPKLEVEDVKS